MGREVGGKNKAGNREKTANSKGLLKKKVWKPTTVEALQIYKLNLKGITRSQERGCRKQTAHATK